jgi:hypothetical protein
MVLQFPTHQGQRAQLLNLAPSEAARLAAYREARDFYDGTQWEGRRKRGETRLTLNYARRLLQAAVAYMFAAPVTFNVPASEETEEGSSAAALAERTLADYLGHIGADELDPELALEASIAGDAAVKVTWDPVAAMPRVTPVDAGAVRVETRPDRPKEPVLWEHHYDMTPDQLAAAMPERRAQVMSVPGAFAGSDAAYRVVETWTAERWAMSFGGQPLFDAPNPYGWLPYLAIVNNPTATAFWGSSDLRDLYEVCRELNARYSTVSDVLQLSGYPIAVLENVDGSENVQVAPGAKWELPEDAKAYLLDLLQGGGVSLHIDYIGEIRRGLHDLSETPRTSFGDSGRTISGAALEVEIQPLVQKVRRKRRAFDRFYRERNRRLLDLAERFGGVALGGVRRAVAVWPDVLPTDADGEAARLSQLTGADNLSHRSAMAEWGVEDPEGEWARVLEERAATTAFEVQVAGARGAVDDSNNGAKERKPASAEAGG